MISQELLASLDDLIQTGARASTALRALIEGLAGPRSWESGAVATAQATLQAAGTAARTEASLPAIITGVRDAAAKLREVANRLGDTALATSLSERLETLQAYMKIDGIGLPWSKIIGIAAGLAACWILWSRTRKVASFERPEPEDPSPRIRSMSRALGALQGGSKCRPLGQGKRLGNAEFEPEIRLEGHSGARRRRRK